MSSLRRRSRACACAWGWQGGTHTMTRIWHTYLPAAGDSGRQQGTAVVLALIDDVKAPRAT